MDGIPDLETGVLMAKLGHAALGMLGDLGVPSFAFVNGLALGGGAEIALNSTYRTIDSSTPAFALPEVFLGLIPGWGGAWILPNLIGIENALEVMISNPLKNNRMLKGPQAFELGIADAMFGPATFLEDSLKWADGVLGGIDQGQAQERAGQARARRQMGCRGRHRREDPQEPHRHGREEPRTRPSSCSRRPRTPTRRPDSPPRTPPSPS